MQAKPGAWLVTLWLCLIASSTACSPSDGEDPGEPAPAPFADDAETYCAPIGSHLTEVCQAEWGTLAAYLAADARKSCRGLPVALERNCLLTLNDCSQDSLIGCDAPSRSVECDTQEDCPGGLLCDTDYGECLECLQSEDCDSGSVCDQGLCIPEDFFIP